jgi:hypothetical protein
MHFACLPSMAAKCFATSCLLPDPTVPDPSNTQMYNRYMFVGGNPISFMDVSGYDTGDEDGDGDSDNGSGTSSIFDSIADAWNDLTGGKADNQPVNGNENSDTRNFGQSLSDAILNFGNAVGAAAEMLTSGKKYEETVGGQKIRQHFEDRYGAYMHFDGSQLSWRTMGWEHTWDKWNAFSGLVGTQDTTQAQRLVPGYSRPLPNGTWILEASGNGGFWDHRKGQSGYTYNGVSYNTNNLTTNIPGSGRGGIQIHPDGNGLGTDGCIGLRSTASHLNEFKTTVKSYLSNNSMVEVKVEYEIYD